jgi:hypothetical protein
MNSLRQLIGQQPTTHTGLFDQLKDPYILLPLVVVAAFSLYRALIFLLTPKPLPGIPHLPHQAPILGDAISLGKSMAESKQTTGWFDSVVEELATQGDGGICQVVFGFRNTAKLVIVSDAHGMSAKVISVHGSKPTYCMLLTEAEDILTRRTQEFDRALSVRTIYP